MVRLAQKGERLNALGRHHFAHLGNARTLLGAGRADLTPNIGDPAMIRAMVPLQKLFG